jgi:predicted nicotinamide N-methyase
MRHARGEMTFVRHRLELADGDLTILQPSDAAELPDDGPVEWAPLVPYSEVLWRSGVALARELSTHRLTGKRVIELGCGLALPSLAAARAGATVIATDRDLEALELVARNAHENDLTVGTAPLDWSGPTDLGEFDLVLAADVLYEQASVAMLLDLLPQLSDEVLLADPGRKPAATFLRQAAWSIATTVRDGIDIYRLSRAEPSASRRRAST